MVWESGRLAFERLQRRLARRGTGAVEAARQWPAHYVIFDLVHAGGDVTGWPYQRRRAALESLFADRRLEAPLTLCPSTTDPATARGWLEWTAAGLEGLCFKRLDEPYVRGARSWRKYKVRATTEAVVGAVTGSLAAPRTVLFGRYDAAGRCSTPGAAPHCPRPPTAPWPICWSRRRVRIRGRSGRSRRAGEHSALLMSSWWSPTW
ncbi:ATP-dependent DNA ligase [Streptomyces olivaceoviridis]